MGPKRAVPNRYVESLDGSRSFFTDVLGFEIGMEVAYMTTYVSPDQRKIQISAFTADPSGLKPDYSVEVGDVDACHDRAVAQECEIVYPLTDEPWGVRRFFVRDPAGGIANILNHK